MSVTTEELPGGVTKVLLTGRIDMVGANTIDKPMREIGARSSAVIIDLSGVEFMASLGLRSLVICAKAVMAKGGAIILLAPTPQVEEVLVTSGINDLIPIAPTEAAALAAVTK